MGNQKNKFNPVAIRNISNLRYVVASNIEAKKSAYYLIVNQWDDACKYFNDRLDWDTPATEDSIDLNVIDIFNIRTDVQNANKNNPPKHSRRPIRNKPKIKAHRETISTSCLHSYDPLPLLVIVHKTFPRMVSYNGAIGAELGM